MTDTLKLKASNREVMRKKTRFLRRQGITPIHLFGHSIESQALQCDTAQLQRIISRAGMTRPIDIEIEDEKQLRSALIREIQRDAINRQILHVDFYQLRKGEKIKVEVPIVLIGEAPALKEKGRMIAHGITSLDIECLPDNIPAHIEVDISHLENVEQAINVKDIVLDPGITVYADPEQLVVKISEPRVREVAEEVPAEAAAELATEAAAEVKSGETPADKEK